MPVSYTRKSPAWVNGDVVNAADAERWEQLGADTMAATQASLLGARPPGVIRYLGPIGCTRTGNVGVLNRLYATPIRIARACVIDRVSTYVDAVGAAGAVWRLGIYANDNAAMRPGSLVLDAGTVSATTTGQKEITITSRTLGMGIHWLVGVPQVAVGAADRLEGREGWMHNGLGDNYGTYLTNFTGSGTRHIGWYMDGVTGALPASFSSPTGTETAPHVVVRLTGA